MYLGDVSYKRLFIGYIFGGMAKKAMLKDDAPLSHNSPTHPTFKTSGNGNIDQVKQDWMELLKQYNQRSSDAFQNFVHPFFGPMNKQELGVAVYKHTDHHLRQFGV